MATTIKLEGEVRNEFGKGVARRLRVANKIPATIYAGGADPAFVTLPMRETTLALRHTNALFTIEFGGESKMAVVKDVQKNPVKRIIEHIDFFEVKAGEKIVVNVEGLTDGTKVFAKDIELPEGAELDVEHAEESVVTIEVPEDATEFTSAPEAAAPADADAAAPAADADAK